MSKQLRVAIQGDPGSYSEEAVNLLLGAEVKIQYCEQFKEAFVLTASEQVERCVVPIENSLAGSIHKNYDLLLRYNLRIVREINLQIQHNLIGTTGTTLEGISTVISHPVALDQCEKFFEEFSHLKRKSAHDTSGSVKRIVEQGLRDWAAIASERAAEHYGGEILMSGIQDNEENFTRFFLLSLSVEAPPNANKTSIVFSFKNIPGALFKSLSVFALRDIDLTRIESRPIHGRPWEYMFYVDFLGSVNEERVENALNHLREITGFLEVLGCYPRDAKHERKGM